MARSLRWLLVPLLVLPVGFVLLYGFSRDPREIDSPLIGRPAPAFELATLHGGTLSSAQLAGRPYLLNFWASWCIPACVDEHPVLIDAHDRYGDRLAIVGVLYQDTQTDALEFLARYGDGGWAHVDDADGRLAIEYGVTGPPETYFVDAGGIVRARHFGPMTAADLEARVAALLGTARAGGGR
ncbi:MAG: DsbE family thiol:disulfide interchange protein [Candidatus Limnocylindria bacterium]